MSRVTSKGQVTIPIELREALGIGAGTVVEFQRKGDAVMIRKAAAARQDRGERLVERLRGTATTRLTTDEIMALTRGE